MFIKILTPREAELIKMASEVQLENLIKLHENGHVEFAEYLKEYSEDDLMDIHVELLEHVISFEDLKEEPEKIWTMDKHALLVMQFIIMRKLPNVDYPFTKRNLFNKLEKTIEQINSVNLN